MVTDQLSPQGRPDLTSHITYFLSAYICFGRAIVQERPSTSFKELNVKRNRWLGHTSYISVGIVRTLRRLEPTRADDTALAPVADKKAHAPARGDTVGWTCTGNRVVA